jgi:ABC-type antimicrobial peptide transport system permease subunit
MDDQANRSLSTERLLAALSASFGALALLLPLIGLHGLMSFVVTRRTREIGIRLALGATGASAIRLVLRDAVVMIAVGMVIALPASQPSASSSNPSCSASLPLIPLQPPPLHCSSPLARSRQHSSQNSELRK